MIARLRSDPTPLRKMRPDLEFPDSGRASCSKRRCDANPDDRYQTALGVRGGVRRARRARAVRRRDRAHEWLLGRLFGRGDALALLARRAARWLARPSAAQQVRAVSARRSTFADYDDRDRPARHRRDDPRRRDADGRRAPARADTLVLDLLDLDGRPRRRSTAARRSSPDGRNRSTIALPHASVGDATFRSRSTTAARSPTG